MRLSSRRERHCENRAQAARNDFARAGETHRSAADGQVTGANAGTFRFGCRIVNRAAPRSRLRAISHQSVDRRGASHRVHKLRADLPCARTR
jgi:hypothetical protein